MKNWHTYDSPFHLVAVGLAVGAILSCGGAIGEGTEDLEYELASSAGTIKLGDSLSEVRAKLKTEWIESITNSFLRRHPFTQSIPYTNYGHISEWHSNATGPAGQPWVLFIVFGSQEKKAVMDVLYCSDDWVHPLVDGGYNKSLREIRKGDSVTKLYKTVGWQRCDYLLGKGGKWQVRFIYIDFKGRFIEITADAGKGKIISVEDVTI